MAVGSWAWTDTAINMRIGVHFTISPPSGSSSERWMEGGRARNSPRVPQAASLAGGWDARQDCYFFEPGVSWIVANNLGLSGVLTFVDWEETACQRPFRCTNTSVQRYLP